MPEAVLTNDLRSMTSSEITAAASHLTTHLRGRLHDVSLSVQDGGVVLGGRTGSYYIKQLAQHAVMNRVSIPITANKIIVVKNRQAAAPDCTSRD